MTDRKTSAHSNADPLSRLPMGEDTTLTGKRRLVKLILFVPLVILDKLQR